MSPNQLPPKRLLFISIIFIIIGFSIIARLTYLQLIQHDFYEKKAQRQFKKIINLPPNRGNIYTQDNYLLATMKTSFSIFIVPKECQFKINDINNISLLLDLPFETLSKKINKPSTFVWLKKHISESLVEEIKKLNLKGLYFIKEKKRFYPQQELASFILGATGVDNQGLSGIEYKYNQHLKGTAGKMIVEKDPRGHTLITGKRVYQQAEQGQQLLLTIDYFTQFITEKYLAKGMQDYQAKKGYAIVLECKTGRILSMASVPTFNPNQWQEYPNLMYKNPCVTDILEPGSVLKSITIAMALEEKKVSKNEILYVPRNLKLYKHTINEAHPPKKDDPYEKSIRDILVYSSNVGTALIAQRSDKDTLYQYFKKFGFGNKSDCGLPGESKGILRPVKEWSGIDLETQSFGQGIGVTPLQLAAAINVFANQGYYIQPSIIFQEKNIDFQSIKSPPIPFQKKIISSQTNKIIVSMLTDVIEKGTAQSTKLKHHYVAGKTGTAQKANPNNIGYDKNNYIASFVGFFPAKDPEVLIAIILDSPQTSIYGGSTSAIIFKNIAQNLANHFHYPPDKY